MVNSVFASEVRTSKMSRRGRRSVENLYQVVVNGEDGEYSEYEVEAESISQATAKAESLAASDIINISYIEVYCME